jgi:DNA primase
MRYDQSFLEKLKQQIDIVRLVQSYIDLKKKGGNYWATCPFHGEKTASFSVNPKGFYYCFGCGKKGSAFNFVMEIENVSFVEAVKIVAEKQGVALPAPRAFSKADEEKYQAQKRAAEARKSEAEIVIRLNSWATQFWQSCLQENNAEARTAREYLEKRAISDETREVFRIGYAPDRWDALLSFLKSKGADERAIEQSGLISKNEEKNRIYDRFRGRVIFPVLDLNGKPIAFGARILKQGEPKYLNSPETAAYTKGDNLYGLFQNAAQIRQQRHAILVEGYFDLITPFQYGIKNCVASLGTALTTNQAKLLSRFTKRVKINYDGDRAGIKAAKRAIEILLAEDFEIKVLVLPNGADPDEFIRQSGAIEYRRQHAKRSVTFAPFVLEQAADGRDFRNAADKAAAFDDVITFLKVIKKPIQRQELFDLAINRFQIDETHRRELAKVLHLAAANAAKPDFAELKHQINIAVQPKMTVAEQELLELLIHDGEIREKILPALDPPDYEYLATANVFRALVDLQTADEIVNAESLRQKAGDSDLLSVLLLSEAERGEGEAIDDYLTRAEKCVVSLRTMAIDRRLREIKDALAAAERNADNKRLQNLWAEQFELSKLRNELGNPIS